MPSLGFGESINQSRWRKTLLGRTCQMISCSWSSAASRPSRTASEQAPSVDHGGQPPPRRLPWVMFGNGTLFDLANDSATHPHHRLRLPDDCWRYSAGENMLFLVHQRDGSCSLLNALSGATTRLPELAGLLRTYDVRHRRLRNELSCTPHNHNELRGILRSWWGPNEPPMKAIGRVVVSSSASDDEPIVVAVLIGRDVLLRALHHEAIDIALFQGKIYALSRGHVLETLDLSNGHQKGFKLKMPSSPDADGRRTFRFEVWEANLSERRWKKLDGSLQGQALFVSRPCSKSLPAGYGVQGDCIYFLNKLYQWKQPEAPLGDSGVYNIRDKSFTPLLRESMPSLPWKSERFPSWFFPVQV
uniref:KIB1-4 beta-propeller domain-containing protein n=1 Tax=Aegilops tauschii TaxID=37682 RepID=M8BUB1_AEGTA